MFTLKRNLSVFNLMFVIEFFYSKVNIINYVINNNNVL